MCLHGFHLYNGSPFVRKDGLYVETSITGLLYCDPTWTLFFFTHRSNTEFSGPLIIMVAFTGHQQLHSSCMGENPSISFFHITCSLCRESTSQTACCTEVLHQQIIKQQTQIWDKWAVLSSMSSPCGSLFTKILQNLLSCPNKFW